MPDSFEPEKFTGDMPPSVTKNGWVISLANTLGVTRLANFQEYSLDELAAAPNSGPSTADNVKWYVEQCGLRLKPGFAERRAERRDELAERFVDMRAASVIRDAETCTSYEVEIHSLVGKLAERMTLEELEAALEKKETADAHD